MKTTTLKAVIALLCITCGVLAQQQACSMYEEFITGGYRYGQSVWNAFDDLWTGCVSAPGDTNHSWQAVWSFSNSTQVQNWDYISLRGATNHAFMYQVSTYRPTYVTWDLDSVVNASNNTDGQLYWGNDMAFDCWTNPTASDQDATHSTEIMIWLGKIGSAPTPAGTYKETDTVAGIPWSVSTGTVSTWKIINFQVPTAGKANGNRSSLDHVDFSDFLRVAVRLGSVNPTHYVTTISAGFEVWGGNGKGLTKRFNVEWGNTSVEPDPTRLVCSDRMTNGCMLTVLQQPSGAGQRLFNENAARNGAFDFYDVRGRMIGAQGTFLNSGVYIARGAGKPNP